MKSDPKILKKSIKKTGLTKSISCVEDALLLGVVFAQMVSIPTPRLCDAVWRLYPIYSRLDYSFYSVGSFLVRTELTSFPFLRVLENSAQD